jgi:hypothetical protein
MILKNTSVMNCEKGYRLRPAIPDKLHHFHVTSRGMPISLFYTTACKKLQNMFTKIRKDICDGCL